MAFSLSFKPRSTCGMGSIQDFGIHGLYEILPPGAGHNRAKLRKYIEEYHIAYAIDFDDTDIDTFIARRPDGLAFDKEKNYVYYWNTPEPWTQMKTGQRRKVQEKNDRYNSLLGFINHLSHREKSGWKASQTNFTTGVRNSLHTNQFLTRLESLGVKNKNTREAIRNRTVQKTLSMSDMILKFSLLH